MKQTTFQTTNLAISFALILFFFGDIIYDLVNGEAKTAHFYIESTFVIIMVVFFVFQIREFNTMRNRLSSTKKELYNLKKSTADLINSQINLLKLTNAEKDVAWLIIKGNSYKKIAELRGVSERTINQQVGSIFKKSNVANRHEFVSSFIEDLMI